MNVNWKTLSVFCVLIISGRAIPQDAETVFNKASSLVFTIETPSTVGTGFLVAPDIFVTCYHVVKGAGSNLKLRQDPKTKLNYILHDEEADIALFRLNRKFSTHLPLADSAAIGSPVYVIGTPLGNLDRSITNGIVSQKYTPDKFQLLQISAAISPGSSGSPVLNKFGQVVGIATGSYEEGQLTNFALGAKEIKSFLFLANIVTARSKLNSRKQDVSPQSTIVKSPLMQIRGHSGSTLSVAFTPDGSSLASSGVNNKHVNESTSRYDECLKFWDVKTGKLKLKFLKDAVFADNISFSKASPLMAYSVMNATNSKSSPVSFKVEVRNWKTGAFQSKVSNQTEIISQVSLSKSGKSLTWASQDGKVSIWNTHSGKLIRSFRTTVNISDMNCTSDESKIAIGGSDLGLIFIFSRSGHQEHSSELNIDQPVSSLKFSHDGLTLGCCSGSKFNLWKVKSPRTKNSWNWTKLSFNGHKSFVNELAFSPDDSIVATASGDKTIKLWNAKTGGLLSTFIGHKHPALCLAFSPDGSKLASGDSDGNILLWKIK
jgi:WD40 repeat protein